MAEELSWSEALKYCRWHHTDLADLHSMSSIRALYSLTSSHEAWIGLFFDVHLGGLRWSGGSSFSALAWGSLLTFREGLCATLYSITFLPSLGAAWYPWPLSVPSPPAQPQTLCSQFVSKADTLRGSPATAPGLRLGDYKCLAKRMVVEQKPGILREGHCTQPLVPPSCLGRSGCQQGPWGGGLVLPICLSEALSPSQGSPP